MFSVPLPLVIFSNFTPLVVTPAVNVDGTILRADQIPPEVVPGNSSILYADASTLAAPP